MSSDNKVVWSEGMFLRAQHFQQHDRYIERLVRARTAGIARFAWGLTELTLNRELLKSGKIAVAQCRGILPDGTPFDIPTDADHPQPLELGENVRDEIVYLTLPEQQPGGIEVATDSHDALSARHLAGSFRAFDSVAGSEASADIEVGKLRLRYALASSERSGYVSLGLARILEVRADKAVILDERYIPPTLSCAASPVLAGFVTELYGLFHHRGEALAARVAGASAGVSEIADFLLLQVVNRCQPLLEHYGKLAELHPESLFATAIQMAGELSTFTSRRKRPVAFPEYRHEDLQNSFAPVMAELRQSLSAVIEENAIAIPLQERRHGIRVAVVPDKGLLSNASFVLAAKADIQTELLRRNFPAQVHIGAVEVIAKLVNSASAGIAAQPLPVAPRQIPFHVGMTYFELDQKSPLWKDLQTSGGIAVHVGGDFPGLTMELWAIRR